MNDQLIRSHQVIINATPLGMFPNVGSFPVIPYNALSHDHLLYDLVYNPSMTIFLRKGAAMGASIKNGIEMFYLQAELSWSIWNDPEL